MFADNDRISLRQMKRQMVISFLGVLLLFQSGDTAAGGIHAISGGTQRSTAWERCFFWSTCFFWYGLRMYMEIWKNIWVPRENGR